MTVRIDRRALLAGGAGLAAMAARPVWAADDLKARYRKALVINGNLVPPLDDEKPLPPEAVADYRRSGLTAMKVSMGGTGVSKAQVLEELNAYDRAIALNPDLLTRIRTVADIDAAKAAGRIGIIYSFESEVMLEGKVENLDAFADRGVRVMQLSYNLPSPFASGVMSPQPSQGLTPLGRELVARMNARGVSIDMSHLDEKSTLGVLEATRKPVAITHAGCKAVWDNPRNKSDAVLKALAGQGGVIGVFELSYINGGATQPTLDVYMRHMAHALKTCGEDHVGIGSDTLLTAWDTSPESMKRWDENTQRRKEQGIAAPGEGPPPYVEGLNTPERCEIIAGELTKMGYGWRAVEKVLGLNWRRWFAATW